MLLNACQLSEATLLSASFSSSGAKKISQRLGSATEKRQMSSLHGQRHVNDIEPEWGNALQGFQTLACAHKQRGQVQKFDVENGAVMIIIDC